MCKFSSKVFLLVTGVIFWLAAVPLFATGGYMMYQYASYEKVAEDTHILVPASVMIAVGVFLCLLGIVGCVGACREQKCLLGFFFVILLIIFLGLVTASVLAYVYKDDVKHALRKGLNTGLDEYNSNDVWKDDIDFIQSQFHCCGVDNYTDWLDTPWYKNQTEKQPYPKSCCEHEKCNFNSTATNGTEPNVYEHGCYSKIHDVMYGHFMILLGVAVALAVFQLIGMIASCVLLCQRRSEIPYIGLVEPSGMRV